MMKNIVITGSTSGIGYGLADSFLAAKCQVTISGRNPKKLADAYSSLSAKHGEDRLFSVLCNVTDDDQLRILWTKARDHFGTVDIWINNAGVAHAETDIWDFSSQNIRNVTDINIIGTFLGSIVALQGMREQGFGSIYNMEGLGSDGRIIKGMALYGLSKSSVSYLTNAMSKEMKRTGIIIGGIRPDMVATKLITEQYRDHPEEWERVKHIFNILSDRVESVAPWIAARVLSNKNNGKIISYLTPLRIMKRFVLSPIIKRNVFDQLD